MNEGKVELTLETYERFKDNEKLLNQMKDHPECIFTKNSNYSSGWYSGQSTTHEFYYKGKDEVLTEMQSVLDTKDEQIKELEQVKMDFHNYKYQTEQKLTLKERITGRYNTNKGKEE